jgi:hypothetical protein
MHWRQNPQRVAWLVLVTSFLICCVSAVTVPLGVRGFVLHASRPQAVWVTATAGTAQLAVPGASAPTAVTERRSVVEESQIATDETAKALLTIATDEAGEQVLATLQLFQGTALRLRSARSPRFAQSPDPHQVELTLERGRVRISTAPAGGRAIAVHLSTPQADITFGTGSFDVSIQGDQTQLAAKFGAAQVVAAGTLVVVNSDERVSVTAGHPPDLPVPAALNLVLNGTFEGRLTPIWREVVEVASGLLPGQITPEKVGQRRAVRFSRRAEDGAPNKVGVQQIMNRDVQGYDSLVLRFDLQLLYQSVPGGGYLASEYPVMVDIFYTDIYGKDLHWYQGFYYMDLPAGSPWLQPTGEKIPLSVWYTYESPNLFEQLRDTRPARINSITIYASGHDYDSRVADVALTVR